MKKIFFIFLLSFSFNLIWENLHFYLYAGYMGGTITEAILLRASVVDAMIIIFIGIVVAILIELHALRTERWVYNEYMPIIPILFVGLTPTIQLGLLGYLSYWLVVGIKKAKI